MEDDNGLELSLGLSCGGSSGKSKVKDVPSDPKLDDVSKNRSISGNLTVIDPSFKTFLQTSAENHDQKGEQKTAPDLQQCENFWTDLGRSSALVTDDSKDAPNNLSQFNRFKDLWAPNIRTADTEEEKSNKRKMPFEEINSQNKHEKVVDYDETHGKNLTGVNVMRNSHVIVTTEDACSGVNEDAAESEAEGSNSWLVSQHEEKSKSSDIPKFSDKYVISDSNGIGSHGQKDASVSGSESKYEPGKLAYGIPLFQPLTIMTVPYPVPVTVPTNADAPNATGFSSPCRMQPMPVTNGERPTVQGVNTSNVQLSFGYSPVQLPTLETGSSWAYNAATFLSREGALNTLNSDGLKTSNVPVQALRTPSAGIGLDEKSGNGAKGNGDQVGEIGSSSQNADQSKETFAFFRQKERTNQLLAEGVSHEGSTIRPGIASDVKFGGCGSYPDLPWVSTTGPNGRTISGVTYKYNQNEVRIVCACHGTHMSPEKFVQHASADLPNPENNNTAAASFPSSNPAASAKS